MLRRRMDSVEIGQWRFHSGMSWPLRSGFSAPISDAAARRRLDELFKEHAAYVARLAYRMMGRDVEIDDVVQDVFVLLLRHIGRIRQPDAVRAWLATTTVRLTRRRLRVQEPQAPARPRRRRRSGGSPRRRQLPRRAGRVQGGPRGARGRGRERAHRLDPPLPRGRANRRRGQTVRLFKTDGQALDRSCPAGGEGSARS